MTPKQSMPFGVVYHNFTATKTNEAGTLRYAILDRGHLGDRN